MKSFLWTVICFALGTAFGTVRVEGRTGWQHLQRAFQQNVPPQAVSQAEERLGDALEDAHDALSHSALPHEHHSAADRAALDRLVARRATR